MECASPTPSVHVACWTTAFGRQLAAAARAGVLHHHSLIRACRAVRARRSSKPALRVRPSPPRPAHALPRVSRCRVSLAPAPLPRRARPRLHECNSYWRWRSGSAGRCARVCWGCRCGNALGWQVLLAAAAGLMQPLPPCAWGAVNAPRVCPVHAHLSVVGRLTAQLTILSHAAAVLDLLSCTPNSTCTLRCRSVTR
jgi:hypothetical protein